MSIVVGVIDRSDPTRPSPLAEMMLETFRRYSLGGLRNWRRGACTLGVGQSLGLMPGRRGDCIHEEDGIGSVADCRLDRTDELRFSLGLKPDVSDAEIVVASYLRFGSDCFSRFKGAFAILVWDDHSQQLVMACDAMAIRPLYYCSSAQGFAVASDPEQLLASGIASKAPDDDMVLDYLLWDTRFTDRSFFRDIKILPPGHVLVASQARCHVSKFKPSALVNIPLPSRSDYWEEYRRRFGAAVKDSITSVSPVVAELSGGLDSSSIVCAANRLWAENPGLCPSLSAVSALYPGLDCDEEPFIRAVAERIRIPVDCWDGTAGDVNELNPSSIALPGGRFSTFSGTDGQIEIASARKAGVLISGIGGDQVGTPWGGIRDAVTERRWKDAGRMIFGRPETNAKMISATLGALGRSFVPERLRKLYRPFRLTERRPYWLSRWARSLVRRRPDPDTSLKLGSEIHRRNWRSLTSGMGTAVMARLQHHAIRTGIEVRFPFLDLDLVAIALSIPPRWWPPPWPFERLHREILSESLPPAIVNRRSKANLQPAVLLRVRRHLPAIAELFGSSEWLSERFVDQVGALRLLDEFNSTETPAFSVTYGVWTTATLEAWLRAVSLLPCGRG